MKPKPSPQFTHEGSREALWMGVSSGFPVSQDSPPQDGGYRLVTNDTKAQRGGESCPKRPARK